MVAVAVAVCLRLVVLFKDVQHHNQLSYCRCVTSTIHAACIMPLAKKTIQCSSPDRSRKKHRSPSGSPKARNCSRSRPGTLLRRSRARSGAKVLRLAWQIQSLPHAVPQQKHTTVVVCGSQVWASARFLKLCLCMLAVALESVLLLSRDRRRR